MGQQQLLLIVLVMIAVGVAILVGFQIYDQTHRESAIDTMTKDLVNLASIAMNYYRTPTDLGGGGQSFTGSADWEVPLNLTKLNDRNYEVHSVTSEKVEIVGKSSDLRTGSNGTEGVLVYVELDRNGVTGFRIEN